MGYGDAVSLYEIIEWPYPIRVMVSGSLGVLRCGQHSTIATDGDANAESRQETPQENLIPGAFMEYYLSAHLRVTPVLKLYRLV